MRVRVIGEIGRLSEKFQARIKELEEVSAKKELVTEILLENFPHFATGSSAVR